MSGYLSLVLHAHLPFVRHPEHEKFLEESWLFEALTESYLPLLGLLEKWQGEGILAPLTLTLTPTLCAMLRDPLLQGRYCRYLDDRIELAEKEVHRNHFQRPLHELASFYQARFQGLRDSYVACGCDLVRAFSQFRQTGQLEIITSAATHALLPLLGHHRPSLRAQILVARDDYESTFGSEPRGIWLPECAYEHGIESILKEANLRWFILETHGILHATPQPSYGVFTPVLTPHGLAAFGRDPESAKQVWSRTEGYPGDPRYRDFYRDIGFDLDADYVAPYLTATGERGFTGLKYHRISGPSASKEVYNREDALRAASEHAAHFLAARLVQIQQLTGSMDRPPILVAPYDAELFGHWWYEGPEFLDCLVHKLWAGQQAALAGADTRQLSMITPEGYLRQCPSNQLATPAGSSWGEEGYWGVWLNEKNQWIYPHLAVAQDRMTELARRFAQSDSLQSRAIKQAGRELLLAQASDWPFIMRSGTSPDYARKRVKEHLLRFTAIYEQVLASKVDEERLKQIEARDNLFPEIKPQYWA